MELAGGSRAKEADLNANGNPAGKRPATRRRDPHGIVAFQYETVGPSDTVRQLASQC
jgi:hypothetical protein